MLRTRVIPSLLLKNGGLVKTIKFRAPRYVGDPINAIRIFNEKEVDELVILDIDASRRGSIDFLALSRINKEAFMPLGYGGGVRAVIDVKKILALGYEKIVIDSYALELLSFVRAAADSCGSQSIVVCIDVKRDMFNRYKVYDYLRRRTLKLDPIEWSRTVEREGAGEILLNDVDREGTYAGYDLSLLSEVTSSVDIPVIALGGARNLDDLVLAVREGGASAVAAGSLFVFHGPHKAVLITYPDKAELKRRLNS